MPYPPIQIPQLRPTLEGQPFPGTELPDLPTALRQLEQWLDTGESAESGGWHPWPDRPDFQATYGTVSLNTGSAGIAWYGLAAAEAAASSGDTAAMEANLTRAHRAATHLLAHWDADHDAAIGLPLPGRGLAFYGGLAGIIPVLLALSEEYGEDEQIERTLGQAVSQLLTRRLPSAGDGTGPGWTAAQGMLGDAGIAATLLWTADRLGDLRLGDVRGEEFGADELSAAAIETGEVLLATERPAQHGSTWLGVESSHLGMPAGVELDGFELGTVGIGYLLARLGRQTGQARFIDAARRAAEHTASVAVTVGDAALFPRGSGQFSFGYCTGSSGLIRSFTELYHATGDPADLEWALRFGRGILRSGVPGRQTPGNGAVLHQCCGSAAVLESFLGLWLETGDRLWLDAARAQADDLLIRSVHDDRGRRWYSESYVLPAGQLKAEVGHQVGASGIGEALVHLYQVEQSLATGQHRRLFRLPDDPWPIRTELGRPGFAPAEISYPSQSVAE